MKKNNNEPSDKVFLIRQFRKDQRDVFVKVDKDVTKDELTSSFRTGFEVNELLDSMGIIWDGWSSEDEYTVDEKDLEEVKSQPYFNTIKEVSINEDGTLKYKLLVWSDSE